MKKLVLLISFTFLYSFSSQSSHYIGNDMRFEQTGPNQFKLILRIATDTVLSSVSSVTCNIFDKVTHNLDTSTTLLLDSNRTISTVFSGNTYGFRINYYSVVINLANNINGYYASATHCCRKFSSNHTSGSTTYTCDIPDPAITGTNSNPKFVDYPDSMFMIPNILCFLNFSCVDPDGDSLVYSIINPFDTRTGNGSKPYSLLGYGPAYNLPNLLGPGAYISIDFSTGIISARSAQLGEFIIAVKCEQYRNGIKIGEVVRDIIVPSINSTSPTSVSENESLSSDLIVYPNPNNGNFRVNLNTEFKNASITLYDIKGKLIFKKPLHSVNNSISISKIQPGMYIAKIMADAQEEIKRIVIE